ncbi:MAG: OmpH family outer membrane protein [Phycisphaerales bacterium]|nr:MAG: OmpH family outer membrane protein [Phycisphaerales bacterium]
MTQTRSLFRSPTVLAVALALVTLAGVQIHSASATKREASIAPAVVGVVDMEKLFGNLKELKDENGKLDGIAKQRKAEIETKEEALKVKAKRLTELPNDQVDQHRQLEQELYEENEQLKVKVALYRRRSDVESGEVIRELYEKVNAEIVKFAQAEGFDLIMIDTSKIKLPPNRTNGEYNSIIKDRSMLFVSERLDITDALTTRMNNNYAAGK